MKTKLFATKNEDGTMTVNGSLSFSIEKDSEEQAMFVEGAEGKEFNIEISEIEEATHTADVAE